jgi:hypothetical protein
LGIKNGDSLGGGVKCGVEINFNVVAQENDIFVNQK